MKLCELRRLVSIEQVLEQRELTSRLKRRGHRLVGPCPVHGGDNPTAFVADCRRNLWNCFTACGGGDVVELIRLLDHVSYAEVAWSLQAMAGPLPERPPAPPQAPDKTFEPYTRRLSLAPDHPFLVARGIHRWTAQRFEVGAWHGGGMLQGCVAVRLHDLEGRPLGYAGRRLHPDRQGKWVFPKRLPKSCILYGWHRAQGRHQLLLVVEGPWEVLRLHQLALSAVALLGTSASRQQVDLLARRDCLLLLDGDKAGRTAARPMANVLDAPIIDLPDGKDPADLSDQQLAALVQPFFLSNQPRRTSVPRART